MLSYLLLVNHHRHLLSYTIPVSLDPPWIFFPIPLAVFCAP